MGSVVARIQPLSASAEYKRGDRVLGEGEKDSFIYPSCLSRGSRMVAVSAFPQSGISLIFF